MWIRRHVVHSIAAVVLALLLVIAVAPSLFAQMDPTQIDPIGRLHPPSRGHLFGTDHLGRDIQTRIVYGTRISLGTSALVVAFASLIGVNVGLVAGYSGRMIDEVTMRVIDLFLAFPLLVLAMAIVAALGPGLQNTMLALVFVWWAQYARFTRGLALNVREREFVIAAKAIGVGTIRILYRHVLPNCVSSILVKATLDVAVAILVTSSLSFLGLGVQPPTPDWGGMISAGRTFIRDSWWYPTFPGFAIFVAVMSINLVGDAIRDSLDPHLKD